MEIEQFECLNTGRVKCLINLVYIKDEKNRQTDRQTGQYNKYLKGLCF